MLILAAPRTVALLPPLGPRRRDRSAREHGPLHGEQLLAARVLARVAPLVQPLDRALHLRAARGRAQPRRGERAHLHVCRALARLVIQVACVGLARELVYIAGGRGEASVAGCEGAFIAYVRSPLRLLLLMQRHVRSTVIGYGIGMSEPSEGSSTSS